ncbi:MAG: hypothetical protein FWG57_00595 [Endomicrobia bacterium]|nr:hypothetical protein [Endomicrobiia bacterium]
MKINFISCKYVFAQTSTIKSDKSSLPDMYEGKFVHSYIVFSNRSESIKYKKQGYIGLTSTAIDLAKALEEHKDFGRFVRQIRIKLNLKETYVKNAAQKCVSIWEKDPKEISEEFNQIMLTDTIVSMDCKISPIIYNQVPFIVNYGCIFLPLLQPIRIIPSYPDYMRNDSIIYAGEENIMYDSININIPYKTSVNEIKKFLDKNKDILNNKLSKLPENKFAVTKEQIKNLNLHEKYSYKEIAEKSGNRSREAIRQDTHRTKKNLDSLFSLNNKQNSDDKTSV